MNFFEYLITIMPGLLEGLLATLFFTFFGMIIGFMAAVPLCVTRQYGSGISKTIISGFVKIIRGTPLLVQLYMIYYGLPKLLLPFGIQINPYIAATIGFTINSAAYQIEYMKGGFKAIANEQIDAARSIGMTKWQTIYKILIPQGLRFSIPSLSNELIYLLKYSSLGFVIQAPELMTKAKLLAGEHARYMETYIVVAIIYIILTFIFSKIANIVENKTQIPGFKTEQIR